MVITPQVAVSLILIGALLLFIWGRWRHDVVAIIALMAAVLLGVVPVDKAFVDFGHPAVITVAAVLIVGRGLVNSGLIDQLGAWISKVGKKAWIHLALFVSLITLISGFVNNIGALAILMPVVLQVCRKEETSPSMVMMPLAFGSLLGGMVTLIGTPPNIIISTFREDAIGAPFQMFDFTPVGFGVALGGLFFILTIGWRLIPYREGKTSSEDLFEVEKYMTEIKLPEKSPFVGKSVGDLEDVVDGEVAVLNVIRGKKRHRTIPRSFPLKKNDVLAIEADSTVLEPFIQKTKGEILSDSDTDSPKVGKNEQMMEAVVLPAAQSVGKMAARMKLRQRFDINLIAVSRQGSRIKKRFHEIRMKAGDVLLLKGEEKDLLDALPLLGCLPLADRGISLQPRRMLLATLLLSLAMAANAFGVMQVQIAFTLTALAMLLTGLVKIREMYDHIDWSIIVLLGAMIPIGKAFEETGLAGNIANQLMTLSDFTYPTVMLGIILVATMFLSDIINNAAAAVLMAPIALKVASGMGASPDPFLMSVAIGASCAFLTPIGHQSNALVVGVGGYQFSDYWKMGLPLEIIITAISLPLLAFFWPLY